MEREKLTAIVSAVQRGETDAAGILYDVCQKDIYYFILKTVNDPELASDLTQDTFLEILQTIGALREPAAFVSWSRQIAYHRCTAYFRGRREILADENEDGSTVFDGLVEEREEFIPGEALDKEDLKNVIHAMIAALPEEQRSAVLLRYFDELSIQEIAQIQGVSEGTVKSRLNYARKAIKKAVEEYEKKNDVKLHCAGVVPLLLWLFREYALSHGISLTSKTASATYAAPTTAVPIAAGGAGAMATEASVTGAKTAGAKAAGAFSVKKFIVGIVTTAVVIGGIATGVVLQKYSAGEKPDATVPVLTMAPREPPTAPSDAPTVPDATMQPTDVAFCDPAAQGLPALWSGYGVVTSTATRRFDLTVEEIDETHIRGQLVVSAFYESVHETAFSGVGTVQGGKILYDLTLETPAVVGTIPQFEYSKIQLVYDRQDDSFSFDDFYKVSMERQSEDPLPVLIAGKSWSGLGTDGFYIVTKKENHLFVLDVYEMTEAEISGKLTVSYDGQVDHVSEFHGRGYSDGSVLHYEIKLDTPRIEENIITTRIDSFWMTYDLETGNFSISAPEIYRVVMAPSA